jgi:hypothetical protein
MHVEHGRRTNVRGAEVLRENTVLFHFIYHKSHRDFPGIEIGLSSFNLRAVPLGFMLDIVLFPLYILT